LQARAALQRKQTEAVALRDEIDLQQTALTMRRAEQAVLVEQARREQGEAEATLTDYDQQARSEQASIATLQAQYQRELEETERRRDEEQRRVAAAATATAQARGLAAAAQSTAQAQASVQAQATARAVQGAQATASARAAATVQAQAQAARATSTAVPQGIPTSRPASPTAVAARPAATSTPVPAVRASATRSGPITIPGSVSTTALPPSGDGFIWPVTNPVITTEFGERSPFQASHTGLDMAQSLYTPVRAASDGIVIDSGLAVAGKPSLSYGMRVSIAHTRGYATLYAHLDDEKFKPTVKAGDRIQRGQLIGYIGMTGLTTGPHLHFEVLVNGDPRNPRTFLPK
jgi:murein DD-endopeptidase MepM/ murein hydrolase activator NlpD